MTCRNLIIEFAKRHTDVKGALESWFHEVCEADWDSPKDIRRRYVSASFLDGNKVVFNIKGNRYRLVVKVAYQAKVVKVLWVGPHAEYDKLKL